GRVGVRRGHEARGYRRHRISTATDSHTRSSGGNLDGWIPHTARRWVTVAAWWFQPDCAPASSGSRAPPGGSRRHRTVLSWRRGTRSRILFAHSWRVPAWSMSSLPTGESRRSRTTPPDRPGRLGGARLRPGRAWFRPGGGSTAEGRARCGQLVRGAPEGPRSQRRPSDRSYLAAQLRDAHRTRHTIGRGAGSRTVATRQRALTRRQLRSGTRPSN